ncbi:reverse transcriptase domain-containing protein [Tanacetum coccineum]
MKAKQEKDMFEYSTDLNSSQDEDTSCAWKKIENLKLSKFRIVDSIHCQRFIVIVLDLFKVDSDDEEVPLEVLEIKKQTALKSETSFETKSPRRKDGFGQRSRRRGLGYRNGKVPSIKQKQNPREHVNDITTRSGKTCEGPSTPLVPTTVVSTPLKEPEQDPETSMDKVQKPKIGLKDALIEMPKFNKWLSTLLRNKEKLEEIGITTVNAECSAIILNKVPEKLKDPGKFLIPCALQELDRTNALADFGASINLLPHSIYKQLGLGALKPTRITLELANCSVTHPMGIAEDVVVRVDGFTFLADFVVVNFEPDPRVPIILGRPFLRTAKSLIDLYEEKLTLRVGNDELSSNENPLFYEMDEDVKNENSNVSNFDEPVLLNTPLTDKVECSDSEDDIDEIDAFLAMEVSSNFEEGYYDSEGDLIFLENLLSDDTTHNLDPEVISNHEPKQNESITFSPRSDHLHHEFVDDPLTLPSRNDHEFEEYLSLMTLLCEISTSRSQENVHANPSSIIASPIPVEDNEPVQEEIDIFLVPDDLISLGVENDDSEDEDNSTFLPDHESPNLDHQDNLSSPRPPPEPPDICLNFKPDMAMKKDEDFNQGEIVLPLNVEDVNSFTFVIWTFLPFFKYPKDSLFILSLSGVRT